MKRKTILFVNKTLMFLMAWMIGMIGITGLSPVLSSAAEARQDNLYQDEKDLMPYIISCQDKGMQEITFLYSKDPSDMDLSLLRDIACAYRVHLNWKRAEKNTYDCTLTLEERAGRKIISSLRAGDTGRLNEKEMDLYQRALEVVRECESVCGNDWERELWLFNWVCSRTVYNAKDTSEASGLENYLTAFGVFDEGSANCQGYTDAFYLLGNLAGLSVDMQECVCLDGSPHITNTIWLNGIWQIVDLTIADDKFTTEDAPVPMHATFNTGTQRYASEVKIRDGVMRHPITTRDTDDFYYNKVSSDPWFGYQASFTDFGSLAAEAVNRWINTGDYSVEMLLNRKSTSQDDPDLKEYINDYAEQTGNILRYYISVMKYPDFSAYLIRFQ